MFSPKHQIMERKNCLLLVGATLPETNSNFAPETSTLGRSLKKNVLLGFQPFFRGYVMFASVPMG